MKKKWDWLSARLSEKKLSRSDFARKIRWSETRISEMITNRSVNDGKVRNFPQEKLKAVSEILGIDFESLWAYNVGKSDTVIFVNPVNMNVISKRQAQIINDKIISNIRKQRIAKGITPYRISKDTGISTSSLYKIENLQQKPTLYTLIVIADYLKIDLSDIMKQVHPKKI
jgi:transcriptional regulator with XRE-family HTH domain